MIYNEKDIIIAYSMKKRLMKWKIRPEVLLANIIMERRNEFARANKRKERDPAHCRQRNRGYAIEEMSAMRDDEFKRMFRVDRSTFEFLCNAIQPWVRRDARQSSNSSGQEIGTATRLGVTLRWLAGGMQWDLCFAFGISRTSFYSRRGVLWPTIRALDAVLSLGFPIGNVDELDR